MPPKDEPSSGVLIHQTLSEPSPAEDMSQKTARPQLSDVAMAKASPSSDKELWWIYGNGYDLQPFVQRHPGGQEAILLGKGRDCTALVESYHAFSSQHSKVLEKYLVKITAKPSSTSSSMDPFYDVLKRRAAIALKEKGIDPVKDRGAGWWRMLYYVVVVAMVLVTGYYHVKVRLVLKQREPLWIFAGISCRSSLGSFHVLFF